MMLPTKFRFIWQSGFREEDFLEINQSETRIAVGSTYGRFCIKFPQSRMKGERHRLSPLSL
jgi:hypothetical protein